MSVLGVVIRWGSMGAGAALVACGVASLTGIGGLSETATSMTPAEALALAGQRGERFVSIEGGVEQRGRVWESLVAEPRFARVDANRDHPIVDGKVAVDESLLGVTVVVNAAVMPGPIECRRVRMNGGTETLEGMHVLAPVQGWSGMLWVLSSDVRTQEQSHQWQGRVSYRGALGRFEDIRLNVPGLGYEAAELRAYARDEMGLPIPEGALVVMESLARGEGVVQESYAAVEGTNGNLIVRLGADDERGGRLTGVLRTGRLRGWERELPGLVGPGDAANTMLLDTTTTGAAENAKGQTAMGAMLIGGSALLVFGGLATWVGAALRRRVEMEGFGGISPDQAIALGIPVAGPTGSHTKAGVGLTAEDAALEAEMARWTTAGETGEVEETREAA